MNYLEIKWNSFELMQPGWLWLIPLFIIINLVFVIARNKYILKSGPSTFSDVTHQDQQLLHPLISVLYSKTDAITRNPSSQIFNSFIFIILVMALAQPIRTGEKLPEPPQARDIVFIVDTSVSMILRDYIVNGERVDRMSLLKGVLDKFIRQLKGERISIIVFGDHAYTLVPFTNDQYLLLQMVARIEATMAGRFNAMGEAIAVAVKQSILSNENNPGSKKRKRILVLLTDADQPTGNIDPVVAAELAKKEQLPLYTIAIGSTNYAAEEQRKAGLIYSPVDLNLIKNLSGITAARSYQAGDSVALEKAIQSIISHETNKGEVKPVYYRESLYHWFVIAAFVLFSLAQLLSTFYAKKLNKQELA